MCQGGAATVSGPAHRRRRSRNRMRTSTRLPSLLANRPDRRLRAHPKRQSLPTTVNLAKMPLTMR